MTTRTTPERLSVLETKVAGIEDRTQRIETKIDTLGDKLDNCFVRQSVVDELEKETDNRFASLSLDLQSIKNYKANETWILRMVLAISVIVNVVGVYNLFSK